MRLLVFDEEIFAGGVETLCFNLLPALARRCETLVWVVPDHLRAEFRARIGGVPNLVIEGHNWPRGDMRSLAEKAARVLPFGIGGSFRSQRMRSLANQFACTHFLTTCVFNQPFPEVDQPVFGFVCDVNPAMPAATARNIGAWVNASAGVFAISEFTQAELRCMRPMRADRVHSIPLAAPPVGTWEPRPAAEREYDFYYPAAMNPHKNHRLLFQACAMLAEAGCKFRLALGGPGSEAFRPGGHFANPQMEEARLFLRDHASLGKSIEVMGGLKPPEIASLYGNTRCVILPSSYEGFGLPLAEALARGLPVICSDIPPFMEQIARCGAPPNVRAVPAGDAARLAAAMRGFLDEQGKCHPGENAPPAPCWTWEDAAHRCFELLSAATADASSGMRGLKEQA